jgi:hypothetical protein
MASPTQLRRMAAAEARFQDGFQDVRGVVLASQS